MVSSPCAVGAVLALVPAVVARRSGGGGGGVSSGGSSSTIDDTTFDPPTLEIANLVAYSILLLATLVLFLMVTRPLFHTSTRLPASGVLTALLLALVGYTMGIVAVVTSYTYDHFGISNVSDFALISIATTLSLFLKLRDPAMFAAITLVLHSRYRSVQKSFPALIVFLSAACFLILMMIVFNGANVGIGGATIMAENRFEISFDEAESRFATADKLFYVFLAFQILGSIFLAISAFLIKARTKGGKISSLTLFVVIPLLLMYSFARLIFTILQQRLPLSDSYTIDVEYALDFSTTVVYGLLFITIMSVLVFLLIPVRLWGAATLAVQGAPPAQGTAPPQFFVQGTHPAQGTPPPQFFVQGTPPAQFPGQWGYPQQSQAGYSQPQQYAYVPVYPVQNPGAQPPPANEKEQAPSPPA